MPVRGRIAAGSGVRRTNHQSKAPSTSATPPPLATAISSVRMESVSGADCRTVRGRGACKRTTGVLLLAAAALDTVAGAPAGRLTLPLRGVAGVVRTALWVATAEMPPVVGAAVT